MKFLVEWGVAQGTTLAIQIMIWIREFFTGFFITPPPPPPRDGVLFSSDFVLFLYFFVCFFVSNITRKWLDRFGDLHEIFREGVE